MHIKMNKCKDKWFRKNMHTYIYIYIYIYIYTHIYTYIHTDRQTVNLSNYKDSVSVQNILALQDHFQVFKQIKNILLNDFRFIAY